MCLCSAATSRMSAIPLSSPERVPACSASGGNLRSYAPEDFGGLCQDVEQTLRAVIESEASGFESRPAQALEIKAHDDFARERALMFGREEVLDAITEYVCAGGERPLVLYGVSGSGKSAVMAQASERAERLSHPPLWSAALSVRLPIRRAA